MAQIQFYEIQDVDVLMQILNDINFAREIRDYWLEEELTAKLIFIFRCPDVLFKISRLPDKNIIYVKSKVKKD